MQVMHMKKSMFASFIMFTMALSLLTSCGKNSTTGTESTTDTASEYASAISADNTVENASVIANQYSAKDTDASYDEGSATKITLNGSSITVDGSGARAKGSVLTISSGGLYVLSGTLSDGQIIVTAAESDDVRLVLNGVTITCSTSAPIYATAADKLIITLVNGTTNTVTDGGSGFKYTDATAEEPGAAIFAKCDLTINGSGSLTVNAGFNNGIGT